MCACFYFIHLFLDCCIECLHVLSTKNNIVDNREDKLLYVGRSDLQEGVFTIEKTCSYILVSG